MENLQDIINNSFRKFVKSKEQILDQNIGYILFGGLLVLFALIIVVGGASFGLCKKMDLGKVCTIKPLYRNLFLATNCIALLFWILYYLNLKKQTQLVDEYEYKNFFPLEIESEVNRLKQTNKIFLILANVFSVPAYVLFLIIIYNAIRFVFNLLGLPFLV
jgi:hypothetical protein